MKTNRLATAAFISALVVLFSLALYWLLFPLANASPPRPGAGLLAIVMDATVPLRNLCAGAAVVMGILALLGIRKQGGTPGDRWFAWLGVLIGSGWLLFGVVVGGAFLLAEALH